MEYGIEASLHQKADLASRNKLKTLFRLSLKHGDIGSQSRSGPGKARFQRQNASRVGKGRNRESKGFH